MIESTAISARDKLEGYLLQKIRKHQTYALLRRIAALFLLGCAIVSAGLVVINVATKWFSADQLSALTGGGGLLLTILRIGRFQEQARWNKLKQRRLEALHRQMIFEGVEVQVVSSELSKVIDELEGLRTWLEIPGDLTELTSPISGKK